MTYLFTLMALPVIDAVLLSQGSYPAILVANALTILILCVAELQIHYK